MKDRLEKYIVEHKEEFSDREAPSALWDKIEIQLDGQQPEKKIKSIRPLFIFISGMAASLIIGILGVVGYQYTSGDKYTRMVSSPSIVEYQKLEEYYIREVNHKLKNLSAIKVDKTIKDDITQLDAIYHELKAELLASGNMNNHEIIEALIKNYKTKIELLEFIQQKHDKASQDEDETINI
jgi:hypothetical protein